MGELAARGFLSVVREEESRHVDSGLELACRYNDLAVTYLLLRAGPPRVQEGLAYLTLAHRMIRLFLPDTHLRVETISRNLDRARLMGDVGKKFSERPYLWYVSLEGGAKKKTGGKKGGKKKKK